MIDVNLLPRTSGIYCIESFVDAKKYIGQAKDIHTRVVKGHIGPLTRGTHHNQHLQNAWDKYGEDNFTVFIIEQCPVDVLDEREIYYIGLFDTKSCGYNYTDGGGGRRGYKLPESVREKMSKSQTGKHHTEEAKEKMRAAKLGKSIGAAHHCAVQVRCVNTGLEFPTIHSAAEYYGCCQANILACLRGKRVSAGRLPETNEKLHWEYVGKETPTRGYEYNPTKMREVVCENNGLVFNSIIEASRYAQCVPGNICAVAKGKRYSAGKDSVTGEKLRWRYKEDSV